ncbi:hypothetical protein EVA_01339 [gut metagenome]|uniref:Uncharacterized protein n=1 Tax=gut metagenome TaxID=749906 RepID=J9GR89_9ZZZZ
MTYYIYCYIFTVNFKNYCEDESKKQRRRLLNLSFIFLSQN